MRYIMSLVLLLLSMFSISLSDQDRITLPSEPVLYNNFEDVGCESFARVTGIIGNVAGKSVPFPSGVLIAVTTALEDYATHLKKNVCKPEYNMMTDQEMVKHRKFLILKALLKDNPDALKELEQKGFYKPLYHSSL